VEAFIVSLVGLPDFLDLATWPATDPSRLLRAIGGHYKGEDEELHRDRVVGVADHVPACGMSAVREDGVAAGHVFFGMGRINFVINLVALGRDSEKTDAVHGASGGAELGHKNAQFVPGKIGEIGKNAKSEEAE
jgi:hypothetical protein